MHTKSLSNCSHKRPKKSIIEHKIINIIFLLNLVMVKNKFNK